MHYNVKWEQGRTIPLADHCNCMLPSNLDAVFTWRHNMFLLYFAFQLYVYNIVTLEYMKLAR